MREFEMARAVDRLERLAAAGQITRRQLLRRATALGLGAPTIALLLAACGGSSSEPTATTGSSSSAAPTVIKTPASSGSTGGTTTSSASPMPALQTPSGSPAANLKPPGKNQTLIFPYPNSFRTLDPAGSTEAGSIEVTHNSYEGLVATVPRSADIAPRLAKSWEVTNGAQTITFTLQQGVKFQDGTMMDSAAVKFSFERVLKMNLGNAAALADLDTIETPDQFTIKFNLKQPNAYFVENCTQIGILSPTAIQKNDKGGDYAAAWLEAGNTCGTGPFKLTSFQKDVQYVAERHPDYWRGFSDRRLQKIVWPIVPEATTRRQMLEKGDAHIVTSLPLGDAKALESNPACQVLYTRAFIQWTMPMMMMKGPLDNIKLRQAMQYAFDYETYLNQVWYGHGYIANGATPIGLAGYQKDRPVFKQDLDKAKQLIAESGLTNIQLEQQYIDTSAEEKQSAVVMQDALKKIGIDLKLTAMPWATMFKLVSSKDTAANMTNLQIGPTRPDPAFTMEWAYGSKFLGKPYNWSYFSDSQVDDLIAKARASVDRDQGRQYLEQANKIISDAAPTVWYVNPDRYDTISAKVQNLAQINIGYPHEIDYFELYLSD